MEKEFPMGRRKQRLFEARFKEEAVRRMLNGESIMRLSRELDVARAVLYRWRDTYRAEGLAGLERRRGRPRPGQQVVSLKSRDPAAERSLARHLSGRGPGRSRTAMGGRDPDSKW